MERIAGNPATSADGENGTRAVQVDDVDDDSEPSFAHDFTKSASTKGTVRAETGGVRIVEKTLMCVEGIVGW